MQQLQLGNARYARSQTRHPHTDADRWRETAGGGQHPFATVISCSDSRQPVKRIFDQGVGEVFVIRAAGNVCDTDEAGSIEYGLCHVKTPVLGHTQCSAVTAVTQATLGHGHALERNIPALVDNIQPRTIKAGDDLGIGRKFAAARVAFHLSCMFSFSPVPSGAGHSGTAWIQASGAGRGKLDGTVNQPE